MKDRAKAIITEYKLDQDHCDITIKGRLDADTVSMIWPEMTQKVADMRPIFLRIDAAEIDYCDGIGAALLLRLKQEQLKANRNFQITRLRPEFNKLIDIFDPGLLGEKVLTKFTIKGSVAIMGRSFWDLSNDLQSYVSFSGELFAKFFGTFVRPGTLRWGDTFLIAEKSGADAVGITCLLGFLIGLILAFQSAVGMQKFGAEIYVADLIVISLFRELGPLITAIIFASRSGSAYAAEIGTMKVNEEIDALTTMGIDAIKFLAIPRMISGIVMMPLLTMFNLLFGLIGCALVMISLGFSMITYFDRIQQAASIVDLAGGLAKTLVFGALIAAIGCLRGLQTGTGASAVGDSATRAVVTSIIAIVIVDGVFAVVYFYLGI